MGLFHLFADVELGPVRCAPLFFPEERNQVVRSREPQEAQGAPDQDCLLNADWKVWVFFI